ncbi:MAG: hypothetical protein R3A10_15350 [Caldilineaceae bacterium]
MKDDQTEIYYVLGEDLRSVNAARIWIPSANTTLTCSIWSDPSTAS